MPWKFILQSCRLTLETQRLTLEPDRLTLKPWKLTQEFWGPTLEPSWRLNLEPDDLNWSCPTVKAVKAHSRAWKLIYQPLDLTHKPWQGTAGTIEAHSWAAMAHSFAVEASNFNHAAHSQAKQGFPMEQDIKMRSLDSSWNQPWRLSRSSAHCI
jgi:hypothetical protein